ncbi:MAG TPA: GAF domain-containing protein [Chloroflexaceae bacterium]|nr:GAF domain-containing protein [Chloroflexaceae bacterium]
MTDLLGGDGEVGRLARGLDWASTPLGPPEAWPQSLRSAASICLGSPLPAALFWGPRLALLYNDAWGRLMGERHPAALGRSGPAAWPELWPALGPHVEAVLRTGAGAAHHDQPVPPGLGGPAGGGRFSFSFSPVAGEDGAVAGVLGVAVESERLPLAEARAARDGLERMLNQLNDHYVAYDRDWRYVFVNTRAAEVLGLPVEQLLGRRIWDLFPDAVGNDYYHAVHRALDEQRDLVLEFFYEPFGRWFENRIYAGPEGVSVLGTDITERKRAETALRDGEARVQLAMRANRMVTWEWDVRADRITTSAGFPQVYGLPALAGAAEGFALVFPEDRAAHLARVQRVAAEGGEYHSEFRITRPDNGQVAWLEERATAILDGDGRVQRLVGVTLDMTARKQTELNLTFLADLGEDLARLASIDELMGVVGAKLGAHLGLSMCAFCVIDEAADEMLIAHEWRRDGQASPAGPYRVSDLVSDAFQEAARAGELIMVRDTRADPLVDAGRYAARGIGAFVSVPLIRDGQWLFLLTAYDAAPRAWQDAELALFREVTTRIWTSLERRRAEQALRESEARYRTLFTSIDEGFCVIELIFEGDAPVDYRFIEINPTFEHQTGLRDAEGRTARELVPDLEAKWFAIYGGVAQTGQPVRFVDGSEAMGRWFDVYAFRIGGPASRRVALLFNDITERKRHERNAAFLAGVSEDLADLSSSDAIMRLAAERIGRHFGVAHCAFAEFDPVANSAVVQYDWRGDQGARDLAGMHRLSASAAATFRDALRSGATVVVSDVAADPRTAPAAESYRALKIGSLLKAPHLRDGQLRAVLMLYRPEPYSWRDDEVELLRELIARVCTRIDRARAEERLRALQDVTASFAAAPTLADVGRVVLGELTVALGAHRANLRLVADEGLVLEQRLRSDPGRARDDLAAAVLPLEADHPAAEALRRGEALFFGEAQALVRGYPGLAPLIDRHGVQAHADLPLRRGDECFGVLSLSFPAHHAWDEGERAFALALADRAAVAYERARLFEAERRARERAERLQAVTAALSGAATPEAVYEVVLTHGLGPIKGHPAADHELTARTGTLYLLEADTLTLAGSRRSNPALLERYHSFPLAAPVPAAEAARSGSPVWIRSRAEFARRYPHLEEQIEQLGAQAAASVPLMIDGRVLGVLNVTFAAPLVFDEAERGLLLAMVDQAAQALERGRLLTSLHYSEERYRRLVEASAQIVWRADGDGRLIDRRARWGAMSGLPLDELPAEPLDLVHPDDRAVGDQIWRQAVATKQALSFEQRVRWAGGGYRHWQVRAAPVLEPDGRVREWIGTDTDITERKQAEREREHLLAREQELRQQAEAANRLKDEFLATVSHELRTPLTAFLGYAQLLQMRRRDEAYVARTVEKMVRSAKAQAQLIEDLLDISRIVSGKLRLDARSLGLAGVVRAALDTVRPAADAKGLALQLELAQDTGPVIGDAGRLQQVVWNLLSNAVKFTPTGGAIAVRLEQVGPIVQLTVSDTGQGIAPDFLPYVFDRFRQADGTANRAYGGLGLGLAIVRHLVELHGGSVQAASDGEGRGATFTVRLPLASVASAPPAARGPSAAEECPPELAGLRVLIVEDQPDLRELLHDVLAPCGAEVRACATAPEALALVRAWRPDVLVSDIAMPGEDGYWLIGQVRALPPAEGGAVPAVALTAYVRLEDRLRVLAAGFQQYVPKPVEPSELRDVVARLARAAAPEAL